MTGLLNVKRLEDFLLQEKKEHAKEELAKDSSVGNHPDDAKQVASASGGIDETESGIPIRTESQKQAALDNNPVVNENDSATNQTPTSDPTESKGARPAPATKSQGCSSFLPAGRVRGGGAG